MRGLYSSGQLMRRAPIFLIVVAAASIFLDAQSNVFRASPNHNAIQYATRATHDAAVRLNERIQKGEATLTFESPGGYLKSLLRALDVPATSQTLVFSENSLQRE